jgi:phosphoglycolate phosphatase-like HAD superfamily hydrolase
VLWDVDFTLVTAPGTGRELYRIAFAELYGRDLPQGSDEVGMAGRTDRAIASAVLALAGMRDPAGQVGPFEAALARLAPKVAGLVAERGRALPGARAALGALAAVPPPGRVLQSLLTGNVRPLAEVKLAPFGLTSHLDLEVGAYGDEHEVRAELVHLARGRAARAYGRDFGGASTVLVGDTPLDVEAALSTGARAVGVATGQSTTGELAAAGAHSVLPDLRDTEAVVAAVLG